MPKFKPILETAIKRMGELSPPGGAFATWTCSGSGFLGLADHHSERPYK